jgi:hypothetical protein
MFSRYDITSLDDKLDALKRARGYAERRAAVGENVSPFRGNSQRNEHTSRREYRKAPPIASYLVGMPGFEPGTP